MQFRPSGGCQFPANDDGNVSILRRHDIATVIKRLAQPQYASRVVMLEGAGGAGKTTLLRLLAEYYRLQEGYTVIHIEHNTASPLSLLAAAVSEPNFAPGTPLREACSNALSPTMSAEQQRSEVALKVLEWLASNPRVALLIDRYNDFYANHADPGPASEGNNTCSYVSKMRSFAHTALGLVKTGSVFVAAVSSSYSPLGASAFTDGLRAELSVTIHVFSDTERSNWVAWHRRHQLLPNDLLDEEIYSRSAYVPRMLSLFEKNAVMGANPGLPYSKNLAIRHFKQRASEYYKERVWSVLKGQGCEHPSARRAEHHQLLCSLIRQQQLDINASLPPCWDSSGMITTTPDSRARQLVCPSARSAILQHVQENLAESVAVLAVESVTRWRAFELCFLGLFLGPRNLNLPKQRATRKRPDDQPIALSTQEYKTIHFPTEDHSAIAQGTFVVPDNAAHNFPVIDAFAYTNEGLRMFIQLSRSKVKRHSTSIEQLFNPQDDLGGKSVFSYFAKRTGDSRKRLDAKKSLPPNYYYVYVCNNQATSKYQELNRTDKDRIIYVTREELQMLETTPFSNPMLYAD